MRKERCLFLKNRIQEIKSKGFNMIQNDTDVDSQLFTPDFAKIKVGAKTLEDAVVTMGDLKKVNPNVADKKTVLEAIHRGDIEKMREISNFFFKTSGIYSRLCKYMANLYRYDWMITPYINSETVKDEKVLEDMLNKIIDQNVKMLEQFENREERVLKYFLGILMKETKGQANPNISNKILNKIIKSRLNK
jgi:Glu-tRNA(Gln) amidotransferase subunit E-like FAD-binding protein